MDIGSGNPYHDRQLRLDVQKSMDLDAGCGLLVDRTMRPREEGQTEVNDRGIERVESTLELSDKFFIAVEDAGTLNY